MVGGQATTPAFTSIFSFITYLKEQGTGQDAFIDALLAEQNITTAGLDIYGSTEINDGPGAPDDVLPVYTSIALGDTVNICTNSQFDNDRDGNKLSQHRYLTLNVPVTQQVTFSMVANPAPSTPPPNFDCASDPDGGQYSDPDLVVWRNGEFILWSIECTPNSETSVPTNLPAGDYTIDINEFRFDDTSTAQSFPSQVCFDFSAN